MPRNLGGVPLGTIKANLLKFAWFVKIEIPAATFLYYTDKETDFVDSGGAITADNATWTSYDIKVGALVQNQSSPLDVSYIDIQNLDNVWSDYVLNVGTRFRSVQVYFVWFDASTDTLKGSMCMYDGRTDEATMGQRIKIALAPHRTPWTHKLPARTFTSTCQLLFKDSLTCQYAVLATPTQALAHLGGAGSLAAATYYYRVSAVGMGGETLASTETSVAATGGSSAIRITPAANRLATSFKIFGRTTGAELLLATITAPTTYFDDTGAVTPSGALPVANTTGTATTCARTIAACTTNQNTPRFGGFTNLPLPNMSFDFGGGSVTVGSPYIPYSGPGYDPHPPADGSDNKPGTVPIVPTDDGSTPPVPPLKPDPPPPPPPPRHVGFH